MKAKKGFNILNIGVLCIKKKMKGCMCAVSYVINGVEYDYWSAKNQQIVDRLIDREVFCCMTSEMEYMLSKVTDDTYDNKVDNPFDESDLEHLYVHRCPDCGLYEDFESVELSDISDNELETDDHTYECPICGMEYTTAQEAKECCGENTEVYRCSCGKILSDDEYDDSLCPAEIYEWWAVSHWFGEKLREQGQVVIESWGKSYWGRCTTGQSISLDDCILKVAENMKILDGMENAWSA